MTIPGGVLLPGDYLPADTSNVLTRPARTERFWVEHLSRDETLIGTLDGVTGGSLTLNANTTLRTGGTLNVSNAPAVQWGIDRVRIWWEVDGLDPWCLGVYLTDADVAQYAATDERPVEVVLTDKLGALAETGPDGIYALAVGTNRIEVIRAILDAVGEPRHLLSESDAVLTSMYVAEFGASWHEIINDIRPTTFAALWTDRDGFFRMDPYADAASALPRFTFEEGAASIHLPEWSVDTRRSGIANVIRVQNRPAEGEDVLTVTVRNTDPNSPTSIPSRGGREIQATPEQIDATTTAELAAYGEMVLARLSSLAALASVDHAHVPVWYNDAVALTSHGQAITGTVRSLDIPLEVGGIIRAEWEVVSGVA